MTLNGLPQFTEITPEKIVNGCSKRAIEYETQFGSHVEALSGKLLWELLMGVIIIL